MTISGLVAYNTIILGIENYENIGCKGNKNLLICQENHTFYDDKKLVNDGRFTVIYKPNNKDKSLIFPIKLNSLSVARGINCEPYIENTWSNEYLEYGDANHILLNQCPNAYINVIEFYRSKYNELPQNTEEINKIMKKEYESIDIETNEILRECTTEGYDQFFEYKVDKITNDYTVYYKGTVIDRINDYPENVYLALNDKSTNKLKVLTAPTFSILLFSIMLIFFLFPYIPIGIIVIYIVIKTNKNKKNKG